MPEESIKAVEMVRGIRDKHYEKLKDLSSQQKIDFFRNKARSLHAELKIAEPIPVSERPARTTEATS